MVRVAVECFQECDESSLINTHEYIHIDFQFVLFILGT